MTWEILWALILGFFLSGVVQAVVSKREMTRLLPDDSPRTLAISCGLGAASSSCSYAAVALARSIFRKGADFTAAMAFEFASTNLVIELGIILALLIGWQFTLAEFVGGPLMVVMTGPAVPGLPLSPPPGGGETPGREGPARVHGGPRRDGHVAHRRLDLVPDHLRQRLHRDQPLLLDGLGSDLQSHLRRPGDRRGPGGVGPNSFWQVFFLVHHPLLAKLWGPLIGPLVAMLSFVCSIGNVPLAAVLWNGGISFGGVIAFIFADLIVLPILNIYRKVTIWITAIPDLTHPSPWSPRSAPHREAPAEGFAPTDWPSARLKTRAVLSPAPVHQRHQCCHLARVEVSLGDEVLGPARHRRPTASSGNSTGPYPGSSAWRGRRWAGPRP